MASLRLRIRKPLSIDERIAEEGDIVSAGEVRSGDSIRVLERLVCEVRASLEDDDCLVCIRRGCALLKLEVVVPVNEGEWWLLETLEVLRSGCCRK